MASKYARLRGKIPELPTPREAAIEAILVVARKVDLTALTLAYNALSDEYDALNEKLKALNTSIDAHEIAIREKLEANDFEGVTQNGYTWSPTSKPRAQVFDRTAMIDHFLNNGMKDLMSVHAQRLDSMIAEEALANDFTVETVKAVDDAGNEIEVSELRSKIPGVKIYLEPRLSRVKSSKGAK